MRSYQLILLATCFSFTIWSCVDSGTEDAYSNVVVVEELVRSTKSWDGQLLPEYHEGQPEITILRISIPGGETLDNHFHPVINAGVLLKGELTVTADDGSQLVLKAGDPIIELVNKVHYGKNTGDGVAEIIVFYAGIENSPYTVK